MKIKLILPIFFVLLGCTSLRGIESNDSNASYINIEKEEINNTVLELKEAVLTNEQQKIKSFFTPTFKNNLIIKEMEKYDISNLTLLFSEPVKVTQKTAVMTMIINYANDSQYFELKLKKEDGLWKIADVDIKS